MVHDPLIERFRKIKIWKKKLKKAHGRGEKDRVRELLKNEPQVSLNHLIRERYPTFTDALRDLDDAVTLIHLFQYMSSGKVKQSQVEKCRRLAIEFQYYVAATHALRKVFVSIKGIYYQAEIFGQTVTWIIPHQFNQRITKDIDYQIMVTFLDFHEVLMGFVNYKLFHSIGLKYPPTYDQNKESEGEYFKSIVPESIETKQATETKAAKTRKKRSENRLKTLDEKLPEIQADQENEELQDIEEEHEINDNEDIDIFDKDTQAQREEELVYSTLFANCVFFLSREVVREPLEFVIKSFGGVTTWEGGIIPENSPSITHQIVDRGSDPENPVLNREYIQPQWVFDSVNNKALLPVDLYTPTAKLPPHLSPFVNDELEGYKPEYKDKLEEYVSGAKKEESQEDKDMEEDEDEEDVEMAYQRELEEERQGKYESEQQEDDKKSMKKRKTKHAEEEEATKMAQSLLPSKKRKLLAHIEKGKKAKNERLEKIHEKKQKLESEDLVVEKGKLKKAKK